jgi:RNA polymerase sigma factor (sigma-70 family)
MGTTDKYYIERCLNGHADDFRHLIRRYQGPLLAHLAGRSKSRDLAEETAQETMVRAYFALGKLKKPNSFFSWLLGIANRVTKEHQRDIQQRNRIAKVMSENKNDPELSHDLALEKAVAALSPAYRDVVLLRYYGDCSCNDIAEQLDVPLGTVTKQLSRAYAMLRTSLQQQNSEVQK